MHGSASSTSQPKFIVPIFFLTINLPRSSCLSASFLTSRDLQLSHSFLHLFSFLFLVLCPHFFFFRSLNQNHSSSPFSPFTFYLVSFFFLPAKAHTHLLSLVLSSWIHSSPPLVVSFLSNQLWNKGSIQIFLCVKRFIIHTKLNPYGVSKNTQNRS